MSEPIIFIDRSEIRDGKLDELKLAIHDLVKFVEANEPRPIAYDVYLNASGTRMTVLQVHPDSESMEFHMEIARPIFSKFAGLIELSAMDIYGDPSDHLLELTRQKVKMLGKASVVTHKLHAGFARFGTR